MAAGERRVVAGGKQLLDDGPLLEADDKLSELCRVQSVLDELQCSDGGTLRVVDDK